MIINWKFMKENKENVEKALNKIILAHDKAANFSDTISGYKEVAAGRLRKLYSHVLNSDCPGAQRDKYLEAILLAKASRNLEFKTELILRNK